ncbi:hypothetical protein Btru_058638 [Bulinus truncatus]|nr:hypothetical protein Btru_058638 [Bulinus truncatus]
MEAHNTSDFSLVNKSVEKNGSASFRFEGLFMDIFNPDEEDPFHTDAILETQRDFLYLCIIFLVGAVVRHATDVLLIPLPYTVVVFFVGVIAGYLPLGHVVEIGPHTIIYVFMPILIFEGSFAIDTYIFKQIFIQVMILAAPALVVMTFLLAGTSLYLFKYNNWNWLVALLFGSILSATDPVAVVAIMKELGTNKRLALLIEGESMLNDGTAMVCYELFHNILEDPEVSTESMISQMIWVSLGGPLFGYIMAKLAIYWLQWTFNDSLTEIAITLSMAYLVFYIADAYLKVSAVLGVVTLGATLGEHRTSISPEVEVFLHSFWETLSFMANTLIFAICGFIITKKVIIFAELQDCIYVIILYFAVNVIRGLTFMMFSPVLKRLGYGLTWQDGLVCTWSGLRGAIGLAMALILFKSENPILSQPSVGGKTAEEKELRERQGVVCPKCNTPIPYVPTASEVHKWLAEATRKYLKLLKQNFWLQFERGLLAGFSVRKLIELAEEASDRDCEMIKVGGIKTMWKIPNCIAASLSMFTYTYVKTAWFFFNLVCLVQAYVDVTVGWIAFGQMSHHLYFDDAEDKQLTAKVFISLRVLRIFQLLELFVAILLNLIKHYIRDRLTTGCDMGRGFVRANELAIRLVDHISDDVNVQNMIRESAEKAKMSVLRELGLLQGLHPDIALGVKTCQAIRSVLNVMREGMHHLMEEGGIDEPDGLLFVKVIESKMKRLMAAPPVLEIPSTKKILAAIPWIDGDYKLVDFIYHMAQEKLYNYGEVILRHGELPDGIYFIMSGLVKVEAPIMTDNKNQINTMQTLDFLSTGNVIGEISVLTQKRRTATLTCETTVKTLYLSTADLQMVCDHFSHLNPPLLARLWKVCAIRISINILSNVASYHGMRKETLLTRLENAELEHVNDQTNTFEITPHMIDVLLIMGEAYDSLTRERYIGPCYIPKTVIKLFFPAGQVPRPLMFFALKPSITSGPPSKGGARPTNSNLIPEEREPRVSLPNANSSTFDQNVDIKKKKTIFTFQIKFIVEGLHHHHTIK